MLNTIVKIFRIEEFYFIPRLVLLSEFLTRFFRNKGDAMIFQLRNHSAAKLFSLMLEILNFPLGKVRNINLNSNQMLEFDVFWKSFFISDPNLYFCKFLSLNPFWSEIREIRHVIFIKLYSLVFSIRILQYIINIIFQLNRKIFLLFFEFF